MYKYKNVMIYNNVIYGYNNVYYILYYLYPFKNSLICPLVIVHVKEL